MTPEQENFDALCRLLKLKRFEQPPPEYFNDFSRQVIARIRAGSTQDRQHLFDRMSWEVPWLQRLIEAFQAKPALAVSFGAAVCGLLVGGVIYSESLEFKAASVMPPIENVAEGTPPPVVPPGFGLGNPSEVPLVAIGTNNSMNPITQSSGSLFEQFRPNPVPVDWQWRGNGN